MTSISGWGRYPVIETHIVPARTAEDVRNVTAGIDGFIARGSGRSYGDASIGANRTVVMTGLNRILEIGPQTGIVTVEAGTLLSDLIDAVLPLGFFPLVVPGTRFVSVGGAIAADIHGKNHHGAGGFGDSVQSLMLATVDGKLIGCSRVENPEVFKATVGGMGLTGTIIQATLQLQPIKTGWILQRTEVAQNLAAAMAALDRGDSATYSVAWIDCVSKGARLGRSLVFLGEHASPEDLSGQAEANPFPKMRPPRISIPFEFPEFALNAWSLAAFNELYFRRGARRGRESILVPAGSYFFPLDAVGAWNRIYGRRGFIQHQCVLPAETAPAALSEMLGRIAARGQGSFLTVLKKLGASDGLLSFPLRGYTLAVDFPMSVDLLGFLDELDKLVVAAGGRIYLAKDARQSRATFEAGYPQLGSFRDVRRSVDPTGLIRSRLSERLGI
jgi:decaprenylphospho-beta-D-ribofuranose 2-oxidase